MILVKGILCFVAVAHDDCSFDQEINESRDALGCECDPVVCRVLGAKIFRSAPYGFVAKRTIIVLMPI